MSQKPAYAALEKRIVDLEQQVEQLQFEAAKYRTLFNSFPFGITVSDAQGKIIETNTVAEQLLGVSKEEHEKRPIDGKEWRIIRPDGSDMPPDEWASVIALKEKRRVANCEMGICKTGGEVTWINVTAAPLPLEGHGVVITYIDITGRKKVQDALAESEARFKTLFREAPVSIIVHDKDTGEIVDANEAAWKGYGFTSLAELQANEFWLDPPYSFNEALAWIRKAAVKGVQHFEWKNRKVTGEIFWEHVQLKLLTIKNAGRVMATTINITELKKAEEALRHRLLYEKALAQISTMAVQAEDIAAFQDASLMMIGETLAVSRAYIFEHCHETNTMNNTIEWCSPDVSPQKENLQDVPAGAVPWWVGVLKEGKNICYADIEAIPDEGTKDILRPQGILSILIVPLFVSGRYHGFMGFDECRYHRNWPAEDVEILLSISRIITGVIDRQQAKERLRESEALLNATGKIAKVGGWELDVQTSKVSWTEETYLIHDVPLDYKPSLEEAIHFFHPDDRDKLKSAIQRSLENSEPYDLEIRFITAKGNHLWTRTVGQPHIVDGKVIKLKGIFQDISNRKRAEEEREKLQAQLNQSHKMESVGRLAGGVAHDFNNMLSVMIGNTELAMENMTVDDPLYDSLHEIFRAANRSADITRQLLAFARKQTIAPRVLDLNATVEGMLKMLRRLIGEHIELAWLPDAKIRPVRMDPSQIDQILANLCVNARDAIKDVGKITIETGMAAFDAAYCADHPGFVPGDFVLLAVSDDGSGMDPETLANLFEPFFTTKAVDKGTGLGLATVYGIVKQNHGFINVYSEPGQGTTFKIYLPWHEPAKERLRKTESLPPAASGNETILLVEDERSILRMTSKMLAQMGYKVLAAGTPGEAMDLAREHAGEIHLLLTDVVMPEMNGRELAGNLLSLYPNLKRLFMSGYTANVIAHHGILEGGVHYIQKPFSRTALGAKVREALGNFDGDDDALSDS